MADALVLNGYEEMHGLVLSVLTMKAEQTTRNALLAAKKELVSIALAIDTAAMKGIESIEFKFSSSITKIALNSDFLAAMEIIEDDLENANYRYSFKFDKNGRAVGCHIEWGRNYQPAPGAAGEGYEEGKIASYTPVDPQGSGYAQKNPANEGWCELLETGLYFLTEDEEVNNAKTYYDLNWVNPLSGETGATGEA